MTSKRIKRSVLLWPFDQNNVCRDVQIAMLSYFTVKNVYKKIALIDHYMNDLTRSSQNVNSLVGVINKNDYTELEADGDFGEFKRRFRDLLQQYSKDPYKSLQKHVELKVEEESKQQQLNPWVWKMPIPTRYRHTRGPIPIDYIKIYDGADKKMKFWHYVSFGFSQTIDSKERGGYRFELSLRLKKEPNYPEKTPPPDWPRLLMFELAKYVFSTGNYFESGHYVPYKKWFETHLPDSVPERCKYSGVVIREDSLLKSVRLPFNHIIYLELIPLLFDEFSLVRLYSSKKVMEHICPQTKGHHIVDLDRDSLLSAECEANLKLVMKAEGSLCQMMLFNEKQVKFLVEDEGNTYHLTFCQPPCVDKLPRVIESRILFKRNFVINLIEKLKNEDNEFFRKERNVITVQPTKENTSLINLTGKTDNGMIMYDFFMTERLAKDILQCYMKNNRIERLLLDGRKFIFSTFEDVPTEENTTEHIMLRTGQGLLPVNIEGCTIM